MLLFCFSAFYETYITSHTNLAYDSFNERMSQVLFKFKFTLVYLQPDGDQQKPTEFKNLTELDV